MEIMIAIITFGFMVLAGIVYWQHCETSRHQEEMQSQRQGLNLTLIALVVATTIPVVGAGIVGMFSLLTRGIGWTRWGSLLTGSDD